MDKAIKETERRRSIQIAYNEKHGITPQTIRKKVRDVIEATRVAESKSDYLADATKGKMSKRDREALIGRMEKEMKEAAKNLQFERAAELRDAIMELKAE
ncbi:UvrABC system protein B [compost metagenome]